MAFLRLNGITIPCRLGSPAPELEVVGETSRAIDASLVTERRAVKGVWGFETTAQAPATALAIRDLLAGRAHSWSFDSHLYSSKGTPVTGSVGLAVSAVEKKYGAKSLSVPASGYAEATGMGWDFATLPWSASFWWWDGAAWKHVVETSANKKYLDGVDVGARTFVTTATNTLRITNPDASVRYCDDLWVCFWVWPATWPAAVCALGSAVAAAGLLKADGDLIENNGRVVTVQPEALAMRVSPGTVSGTRYSNLHTVAGRLVEV